MEEMTLRKESISKSQKNMEDYMVTHDVKYIREDAIYRNLSTGETYKGKAEIGAMLHYVYQVAFNAKSEVTNYIITEDHAMFEGYFRGIHTGEFAGIPATNKEVHVPISVSYDLEDGMIKEARIYFLVHVLMRQLGVNSVPPKVSTTYVVRDIFQLKFGQFKPAKQLLQEAAEKGLLPEQENIRILSDFTGDAYRLVFEEGFNDLGEYEKSLSGSMKADEWQQWYDKFKPLVEKSHREILKQIQ